VTVSETAGRSTDAALWHPWLRVERVMRGVLMHHASEETLLRIEREVRAVLAVRASVRRAGCSTGREVPR